MQIKELFKILKYSGVKVFFFFYENKKDKEKWNVKDFTEWLGVSKTMGRDCFNVGVEDLLKHGIIEFDESNKYRFRAAWFEKKS